MTAHPFAIHQVHDQLAARSQCPLDRFENGEIVLRPLEIAEGVSEDADTIKFAIAEAEFASIALVKGNLQVALLGSLASKADQIARAIQPGNVLKTATRQFKRVSPLPAAQIENAVIALQPRAADQ